MSRPPGAPDIRGGEIAFVQTLIMATTEPGLPAVKTLFALSRNVCSFYDERDKRACEERMTDPRWKRVNGRICHIRGENAGAARYDANMTDAQRHDYENLILLCPSHHTRIDDLEPDYFTVERLHEMKERAERASATPADWAWATDEVIERVSLAAIAEYRRIAEPQRPSLTEPTPTVEVRPLPERLAEARRARDAAKQFLATLEPPRIGEGPHLPLYRQWERAMREVARLEELVRILEAAR